MDLRAFVAGTEGLELFERAGRWFLRPTSMLSPEACSSLLGVLRRVGTGLALYDPLYPSPSDPGAYLEYFQAELSGDGPRWKMTLGNHGWSGGIYRIAEPIIALQLAHLAGRGLLEEIGVSGVKGFAHYAAVTPEVNEELERRLRQLHAGEPIG